MDKIKEELEAYLFDIIDQAKNGITITDPNQKDNPLIFVNQYFLDVFGYKQEEIIGKNCRFLHGDDDSQTGIEKIRTALRKEETVTVTLRNYAKSGEQVLNELTSAQYTIK